MDETQVWSRAGRSCADHGLVGGRLCDGRLAKGRSCDDAKPSGKCARVDTRVARTKASTQGQIRWWTRKGRYDVSSGNCRWESGFKTVDLVRELKHRFGLVVRLIANKCYEDTFSTSYPSYPRSSGFRLRLRIFVWSPYIRSFAGSSNWPKAI